MSKIYQSQNKDHSLTVKQKRFRYYLDNGKDLRTFEFSIYNQFTPREIVKIFEDLTSEVHQRSEFLSFLKRHQIQVIEVDPIFDDKNNGI